MFPDFTTIVSDLQEAARGVVTDAMINRGARWIDALEVEFPTFHKMLLSVLYDTPEGVLDKLAVINRDFEPLRRNPFALEYVRQLQLKLRGNKHGTNQQGTTREIRKLSG